MEAGKVACGVIALLAAIALLYLAASYLLAFTPSALKPPEAPTVQWFVAYRVFDLAFLALAVFAATVGAAALFRYEGERPGPEEESVVEGEVVEEAVEEGEE